MAKKNIKRIIVVSAPSGGGKSTVARYILSKHPEIKFSISATTRQIRPRETDGLDYYFISKEEFEKKINDGDLVEYEEMFGNYYGTLRTEVDKTINAGGILLFDIDVKGAFAIRKAYPELSLLIFLRPPNLDVLEERLRRRSTESEEQIQQRIERMKMEMEHQYEFDYIIFNRNLKQTYIDVEVILKKHLPSKQSHTGVWERE